MSSPPLITTPPPFPAIDTPVVVPTVVPASRWGSIFSKLKVGLNLPNPGKYEEFSKESQGIVGDFIYLANISFMQFGSHSFHTRSPSRHWHENSIEYYSKLNSLATNLILGIIYLLLCNLNFFSITIINLSDTRFILCISYLHDNEYIVYCSNC